MRSLCLFATAAIVAGSIVGFAAPASAEPLCEQVWLRGDPVFTPTNLGQCFPYNSPLCDYEHGGAGDFNAYVYVCVPEV